jgi:hypothetical protein
MAETSGRISGLRQHITDGKWADLKAVFPKDLSGVLLW